MSTSCPDCGHSILSHKKGRCLALVIIRKGVKGHCGCIAIQPPNSSGYSQGGFDDFFPEEPE